MWSEWMARTLKLRPVEDAAAEVAAASPLTLPSLMRWAPPSPTRGEGDCLTLSGTPSPLVGEGRGEGESAPALIDMQCP